MSSSVKTQPKPVKKQRPKKSPASQSKQVLPAEGKATYKYDAAKLEEAKKLYLNYNSRQVIMEKTGLSEHAVKYYVNTGWKDARDLRKHEVIEALSESKKALMVQISKNGLEVLARAMEDLKANPRDLGPKEIVQIAGVIADMDKITKLDDGAPTEIIADTKPATIVEIRKMLQKDPFADIHDTIDEVPLIEDFKGDK